MLQPFIEPLRSSSAQTIVIAVLALSALDMLFGTVNAIGIQHDFASHVFREGLVKKLSNLGMLLVADIVDAMLLSGLDLGFQPIFVAVGASLALMEVWSLLEIFAEMHPEISESDWYQMLLRGKAGKHAD